jgi:hypothetical protein
MTTPPATGATARPIRYEAWSDNDSEFYGIIDGETGELLAKAWGSNAAKRIVAAVNAYVDHLAKEQRLVEALEPLAKVADLNESARDNWGVWTHQALRQKDCFTLTVADCRAARALIAANRAHQPTAPLRAPTPNEGKEL